MPAPRARLLEIGSGTVKSPYPTLALTPLGDVRDLPAQHLHNATEGIGGFTVARIGSQTHCGCI